MPRPYSKRRPSLEPLEHRNLLATLPACFATDDCTLREYPDVNDDGNVSPIDVLLLVNYINKHGSGAPAPENPPPFVDLNDDGFVTPSDAMIIVNFLNGSPSQGESTAARVAPSSVAPSSVAPSSVAPSSVAPSSEKASGESILSSSEPLSREEIFRTSHSTELIVETELPILDLLSGRRDDEDCLDCQDSLAEDADSELLAGVLTTHWMADDINDFFGA